MGTQGSWFRGRVLGWVYSLIRIRAHVIQLKDVHACAKSFQSCLTFCDPMDCSLPGSGVPALSTGFSRQEQWKGSRCNLKGDKKRGDQLLGITERLVECGTGKSIRPQLPSTVPVWTACLAQAHRKATAGATAQHGPLPTRGAGSHYFMSTLP